MSISTYTPSGSAVASSFSEDVYKFTIVAGLITEVFELYGSVWEKKQIKPNEIYLLETSNSNAVIKTEIKDGVSRIDRFVSTNGGQTFLKQSSLEEGDEKTGNSLYRFTFNTANQITAVSRFRDGVWARVSIDANESFAVDPVFGRKVVIKTEIKNGKSEVDVFKDPDGDGDYIKASSSSDSNSDDKPAYENYDYSGGNSDDNIKTEDIVKPGLPWLSYRLRGGSGNDKFEDHASSGGPYINMLGEGGDDSFSIKPYSDDAYYHISGDDGIDKVSWKGGAIKTISNLNGNHTQFVRLRIEDTSSKSKQLELSTSTEYIEALDDKGYDCYYLVEDLYRGQSRKVSIEEVNYRTSGERNNWQNQGLNTYQSYVSSFNSLGLDDSTVQLLYNVYYGRPADAGGLKFWREKIQESGFSYAPQRGDDLTGEERSLYDRIVKDFGDSEEAAELYKGKSDQQCVDVVYNACFGRDADRDPVTGKNYWLGKLEAKEITLSQLATEVGLGAQGVDLVVLSNKITSADRFYDAMDSDSKQLGYAGVQDALVARTWLAQFGDTVATTRHAAAVVAQITDAF